jgi:hypothetical protein
MRLGEKDEPLVNGDVTVSDVLIEILSFISYETQSDPHGPHCWGCGASAAASVASRRSLRRLPTNVLTLLICLLLELAVPRHGRGDLFASKRDA